VSNEATLVVHCCPTRLRTVSSSMVDRVAAAAAGVRDVVLDALLIANVLEDEDDDNT